MRFLILFRATSKFELDTRKYIHDSLVDPNVTLNNFKTVIEKYQDNEALGKMIQVYWYRPDLFESHLLIKCRL